MLLKGLKKKANLVTIEILRKTTFYTGFVNLNSKIVRIVHLLHPLSKLKINNFFFPLNK